MYVCIKATIFACAGTIIKVMHHAMDTTLKICSMLCLLAVFSICSGGRSLENRTFLARIAKARFRKIDHIITENVT